MEMLFMYVKAFLIGGAICVIGQVLIMKTKLTSARILVGYVTTGVILGALGLYKPVIDFAGAGATVPLTGFGYNLAMGAIEGVQKHGLWGAFTGGITKNAAGIAAAMTDDFSALDVSALQQRLIEKCVRLHETDILGNGENAKVLD